jgi:hypothetical protein
MFTPMEAQVLSLDQVAEGLVGADGVEDGLPGPELELGLGPGRLEEPLGVVRYTARRRRGH